MNAVETLIMQAVLKSVTDYKNSIEVLRPGVVKYFNDHYDDVWCTLRSWKLINNGSEIEMMYTKEYLNGCVVCTKEESDTVTLETIVSIAVELSFNKN
jgi:hypothetical protein